MHSYSDKAIGDSLTRRRFMGSVFAATGLAALHGDCDQLQLDVDQAEAWITSAEAGYTLAPNLELMFEKSWPYEQRLKALGEAGAKAYSFWDHRNKDLNALKRIAEDYGMACASISGTPATGWKTGLTATGGESDYLQDIQHAVHAASVVGAANLVVFVGKRMKNLPWARQFQQIIRGLQRAGDIADKANVLLALEPLNRVNAPEMTVLSASEGYEIIREVAHPNVKLNFDIYHIQLTEGNLSHNLLSGLDEDLIAYVEVGDVPGRFEPGTGEINFGHLFQILREKRYDGFVGMEHRAKFNYLHALTRVREIAFK